MLQLDYGVATVVYASNTHKFDGQAGHTHGGGEDLDGKDSKGAQADQAIAIDAGDKRMVYDRSKTIANSSQQTSTVVAASALHTVATFVMNPVIAPIQTKGALIDLGSSKLVGNPNTIKPIGFIPLGGTASLTQEKKNATAAMIQSADNGLFGTANASATAMALGAAAIQWPTLASAGSANAGNTLPAAERRYTGADLRAWDEGSANGNNGNSGHNGNNANSGLNGKAPQTVRPSLSSNPAGQSTHLQVDANTVDMSSLQAGRILGDASPSGYLIPAGIAASSLSAEGAQAFAASGRNATLTPDFILTYPKVVGERVAGTEDTGLRLSSDMLLGNDASDNGQAYLNQPALRISSVGNPTHGQVALRATAVGGVEVVFIPDENYHGTASFSYTVTDQFGLSSTATATIYVESVNDAPITAGESASANEDNIQLFNSADLLANDWDEDTQTDGQTLSIVGVEGAKHGTVSFENGQIRFIPDANYHGPASFTYLVSDGQTSIPATVNLTIAAVNDAPVTKDEAATGDEDGVMVYSQAALLANDTDVDAATDGDVLRISRVGQASHGTVSMDANGDIRFIPDANFHGQASYTYWVGDGQTETPAILHITVLPVNDAPVATDETASGDEDATLMFTSASLLANDTDVDTATDGDVLRISRVGQAEHGLVTLDASGNVRFIPDANYNGPASYTYWVSDRSEGHEGVDGVQPVPATVHLSILQVNDLPVVTGELIASDEDVILSIAPALLLANDRDVDTDAALNQAPGAHQTLSISAVGGARHGAVALLADGTVQFTPEKDYFGAASFTYTVDDGAGGQVVATAVVNLAPVNDAPDVVGETISFDEDEIQTISTAALLANDSDVDNPHADLKIIDVGNATHGTVTLNANGTISYVPDADYFGPARFTYTVSDGAGGFNVGIADLNIAPVNDAPRLLGEGLTADEDQILRFSKADLLVNDSDVDNAHADLRIAGAGNANHGTVSMVGTEIVFTPDLNYNGAASFTYTVSDGVGGTSQATVNLTLNSVNDVPVVNDELLYGKRDHAYTLSQAVLLSNDTDVETPAALTIVEVKNVQHGTATLGADHSVTFVPDAGYAGQGTFEYVVQDADGGQSTGTAHIDFSKVNINPIAVDDSVAGYQDARTEITTAQLLDNDSDPDGTHATLTVDQVRNAQHGTVELGADEIVRFQPEAGYYGPASFEYRVNDGDGGLTWATGFVTVQKANSAPIFTMTWGDDSNTLNATRTETTAGSEGSDSQTTTSLVVDPTRHWGGYSVYDPDGDAMTITVNEFVRLPDGQYWDTKGHVDLNVIAPESAPAYIDDRAVEAYFVPADGRWQYVSDYGNAYHGMDWFEIVATDSHGASTSTLLGTFHQETAGGGGCFPVVIDLKGDGIDLLKPEDSNMFADINKDGWRDQIGWATSADAVLGYDANMDGKIDDANEVSFTSYLDGAKTDLEGLAAFDTDGDGKITANDTGWARFGLLQDANNNGKQDDGEFVSLDQQGIASIDLHREGTPELNNGNVVFGTATVTYTDGHTTQAGDVMFAGKDVALPDDVLALLKAAEAKVVADFAAQALAAQQVAEAQALALQQMKDAALAAEAALTETHNATLADEAHIRQLALLFNQTVNTATIDAHPALGFVPTLDPLSAHVSDTPEIHLLAANADHVNALALTGTHG